MTMQHRHEMRKKLQDFDLFLYAEDDVHVELRHVLAFYAESLRLAAAPEGRKYVLGWQRFEKNGIGARRRRDARRAGGGDRARRAGSRASRVDDAKRSAGLGAEQVMWENGVDSYHAVEVGGRLYATMVNPHAGAWMVRAAVVFLGPGDRGGPAQATREELRQHHKQCHILNVPKTAGSFTRVRAGGWNLYLNCGRRKVLPVANRAGKVSEIPNFKGSFLGRFSLVSADFWTSDHLLERPRSVGAFTGTRARGTLKLKRR